MFVNCVCVSKLPLCSWKENTEKTSRLTTWPFSRENEPTEGSLSGAQFHLFHSLFTVKSDVLFGAIVQTSPAALIFWLATCLEQFATAANNLLASCSCEFVLCRLKIVSLLSSANSFLNWNFNLEYYSAGEIRVLSCEWQRTWGKFIWNNNDRFY